jgi:peptide/nickel transport system permease protein
VSTGDPVGLVHEADEQSVVIQDGAGEQKITARSPMQLFWRRLRRDKVAMTALVFIVLLIAMAFLAPAIVALAGTPDPKQQSFQALDVFGTPTGPSADHPFGVDKLGRDVFSRTVYGSRVSLEVAVIATGIAVLIGVAIGLVAGFYRGWVDTVLSRLTDVVLAFPILLLGLGLAAACSGVDGCFGGLIQPGLPVVIMTIAVINWTYIARIVRGQVLSLREKEFVEAALMTGASDWRIIRSHLMPHLAAPIIVYSTLVVASYILAEAALSFLGVGIKLPTASWGNLLSSAPEFYTSQPWLMLWPGLAVVFTTLAFNLLGDGLRDAFDPRSKL